MRRYNNIKHKIADFGCTEVLEKSAAYVTQVLLNKPRFVIAKEKKMAILLSGKTCRRDIKSSLFTRLV